MGCDIPKYICRAITPTVLVNIALASSNVQDPRPTAWIKILKILTEIFLISTGYKQPYSKEQKYINEDNSCVIYTQLSDSSYIILAVS